MTKPLTPQQAVAARAKFSTRIVAKVVDHLSAKFNAHVSVEPLQRFCVIDMYVRDDAGEKDVVCDDRETLVAAAAHFLREIQTAGWTNVVVTVGKSWGDLHVQVDIGG